MVAGVNLEEVKKYNAALKQYKDQAAALKAEIEYTNRELDTLCSELTTELGVQVTRDNVEQIYNDQVTKINSTLQSGNAVLAKIQSEEAAASQPQASTPSPSPSPSPVIPQVAPQVQPAPQIQPQVQAQAPVAPTITQPQVESQTIPNPVAGSVFGNPQVGNNTAFTGNTGSTLPPMFSL
jgi:hypothetical protein